MLWFLLRSHGVVLATGGGSLNSVSIQRSTNRREKLCDSKRYNGMYLEVIIMRPRYYTARSCSSGEEYGTAAGERTGRSREGRIGGRKRRNSKGSDRNREGEEANGSGELMIQ